MQELPATVRSCADSGGSVITDAGVDIAFGAAAVDPRLRRLHPGQRVRLRLVDGQVEALTMVGFALPA